MAKELIKIELTEQDIKELVAEKSRLDISETKISVSHSEERGITSYTIIKDKLHFHG